MKVHKKNFFLLVAIYFFLVTLAASQNYEIQFDFEASGKCKNDTNPQKDWHVNTCITEVTFKTIKGAPKNSTAFATFASFPFRPSLYSSSYILPSETEDESEVKATYLLRLRDEELQKITAQRTAADLDKVFKDCKVNYEQTRKNCFTSLKNDKHNEEKRLQVKGRCPKCATNPAGEPCIKCKENEYQEICKKSMTDDMINKICTEAQNKAKENEDNGIFFPQAPDFGWPGVYGKVILRSFYFYLSPSPVKGPVTAISAWCKPSLTEQKQDCTVKIPLTGTGIDRISFEPVVEEPITLFANPSFIRQAKDDRSKIIEDFKIKEAKKKSELDLKKEQIVKLKQKILESHAAALQEKGNIIKSKEFLNEFPPQGNNLEGSNLPSIVSNADLSNLIAEHQEPVKPKVVDHLKFIFYLPPAAVKKEIKIV